MGRLTVVAYTTRKVIKYGSIGIVVLVIFLRVFTVFRNYWKKAHPPPPPPPTVHFGKLPKLRFPEERNTQGITFKLANVSGTLPKLETVGKVFVIPKSYPNLLAWDNTKSWAKTLGFYGEPEKISEFDLKFTTTSFPRTTLTVNVLTKNFDLVYDWQHDLEIISTSSPPEENTAISLAKNYLNSIGLLNEDLSLGKGKVRYYKYQDGNLIETPFFSEANFAKVNLYRIEVESLPVLPPNPLEANVNIMLSGSEKSEKQIVAVKYIYFPVYKESFATYPLLETSKAWEKLQSGGGYLANLGNNPSKNILIRNIYLAYFEDSQHQDFLQPIFVFEGDNDFYAYVQAITEQWIVQ